MNHNLSAANALPDHLSDLCHSDKRQDVVQEWAMAWAEYFRLDDVQDDMEVQSLCTRLRSLAASIESYDS